MGADLNIDQYHHWIRLEQDNTAVYINPESVDWIIPSAAGDRLLQKRINTKGQGGANPGPDPASHPAIPISAPLSVNPSFSS